MRVKSLSVSYCDQILGSVDVLAGIGDARE